MRYANPRVLKWALASLAIIVVLVGVWEWGAHQQQVGQEFTLATTRQPERLTELFFADPSKIPSAVADGQSVLVSFIVHNLEAHDMTYVYKITFTDANGAVTTLVTDSVAIKNTQSHTVSQLVILPVGTGRGEINVQLPDKNQSIHFWVERS